MNKYQLLITILCVMAMAGSKAGASMRQESKPLTQSISQAQIIILAQLTKYVPDPKEAATLRVANSQRSMTDEEFLNALTFKSPGQYTFQVLQGLKGQCATFLQLHLPRIVALYYNAAPPGPEQLRVDEGSYGLLLLRADDKGQLVPVDSTLPLIPLGNNIPSFKANLNLSPQDKVIQLMVASLTDPVVRRTNVYLLRNVNDPQLIPGLASYIDAPDPRLRDNILNYMALNQQVIAIPRIAQLAAQMRPTGGGPEAEMAVGKFTAPEAVPYLNPLLFNGDQYLRLNAMFSLTKLVDRSSIPYLLLALRDPESQHIVAHDAYAILRTFNTDAPFVAGEDFYRWRDEGTHIMTGWWQDKLSAKGQADTPPTPKQMPDVAHLSPDKAVPLLNPLLFEMSLTTRQQAMTLLGKLADQSSIPYLLIALDDPDRTIAYSAYKTLHRLISDAGPTKAQGEFEGSKETEVKPLYDWWQDELLGGHVEDVTFQARLLYGSKAESYNAYKMLHHLVPALGAAKDKDYFLAHQKDEVAVINRWQTKEWKKAHPQPPTIPPVTTPNKVGQTVP